MKRFCTITLVIIALAVIGVHFIAPYSIIRPLRINEPITPVQLGLTSKDFVLNTKDGITLNGYWIKSNHALDSDTSSKGIVILIHGISSCKEHLLGVAQELSNQGLESIVFDTRAHGESGGKFVTFGINEREDISGIVDQIKDYNPDLPIGVWGNSLGGAIAIQALESDPRIKFGIIESTFAELDQIVFDYKKRTLGGLGIRSLSDYVLKRAGKIAGFPPNEIKPIESVKNIHQPVFISHGDADESIDFRYSQALFDNLKTEDKEFFLIKNGGHDGLFEVGGVEYKNKIFAFIHKHL